MSKLYPVVHKDTNQVEYIANGLVELLDSTYVQYEFVYSGDTKDLSSLYPLYFDPVNERFSATPIDVSLI